MSQRTTGIVNFGGFVKTKFADFQTLLLGILLVLGSIPAHATFPGKNG